MLQDKSSEARSGDIWRLAWPIILANLTVPLVGLVDTAIMGHLPDPAFIGGVAIGGLIFSYVHWGFGFLRMSTTGLAAQASGAGDDNELRATLARALGLAVIAGIICVALGGMIAGLALAIMDGDAVVEGHAETYFTIRVLAAPAALANTAILGWFFGIRAMRAGMLQQLTVNLANVIFDVIFVFGFDMSIASVAWASVVAQYLGLALSVVMLRHYLRRLGGAFQLPLIIDRRKIIAMTRINADIFIRTLCLLTGTALFLNISAAQGTVILAANAALLNLQTLAAYGLDGFAHAAEVLVGRAIGAKAPQQLRQAVHRSSMMAAVLALLIGLIFYLFGAWIITLLTDIDAVRETAMRFLPWAALAPVISFAAFQLDGIFIGATRSAEMRNAMLVSLGFFWLVLQVSVPLAANHGLWFALVLFLGARSLALLWYYGRVREMADPGA